MAALSHQDSRRMYSWWWNSHISPKNSRWLQENLTDMDAKVKGMIKLINEDADSFARRAEMYYKKRPELMKFVEEFYRAYRALAERYDHATGVIRHAHRTMTDLGLGDDSPAGSDPQTPELTPMLGLFELEELQKDALGVAASHTHDLKSNGAFTDESHSVMKGKIFKQRNNLFVSGDQGRFADGRVRKGLNFSETDEKEVQTNESNSFQTRALPDSDRMVESEEILTLKKALAQVEAEKEAGLIQYQQTLEKLSHLESEVSRAREDSRGFGEQASKAEAEAQTLRDALSALGAEKEANLQQYQKSLDRISELENTVSHAQENSVAVGERASKAELEAQSLREDLANVAAEKDEALKQYMQSLEMIAKLENKLQCAEEDAKKLTERAEKAESEIEFLKQEILKLTGEKEAAALQLQQCLETISTLEYKLSCAKEDVQRLNAEINDGVAKLEGAEERCLLLERSNKSIHSELESLTLKMGAQSQELTEKQKELGTLWTCVQEERLRFVEAETAFQTLQHLHAKAQEEMRAFASELQNRLQVLKDLENHNQTMQGEIQKVKEENKNLGEINVSSAISMRDMQNEISSLSEAKGKLEVEVELRMDQRNALQQEIYCLKEELNDHNKKLLSIVTQVRAVGLDPECFESSVKELQDEKSNLGETCKKERSEKVALLEKLQVFKELLEKNSILENSLSDLSAELEAVRGNLKALEDSCQSLLEEKSALVNDKVTLTSELQVTIENLEKVSAKNTVLENSLSDAHAELQSLKVKSKSLDESCEVLVKEKADLGREKENLFSQLQAAQIALHDLEGRYSGLEQKHTTLEQEKELALHALEELRISLDTKNCEHDSFVHTTEVRLAGMESEMHLLQDESQLRKQEFDRLLEKATESDILNFTLRTSSLDLEGKGSSLLSEYQKLCEASALSKTLIFDLKQKNVEQQMEMTSLFDQVSILRKGIFKLLKALDIVPNHAYQDSKDQVYLDHIFDRVEVSKESFYKTEEENHRRAIQMNVLVTLLEQLKLELEALGAEKTIIRQELNFKSEQSLALQSEAAALKEGSAELKLKMREKDHRRELLVVENCNLAEALQLAEDELKTVKSMMDQLNLQVNVGKNLLSEKDTELQGMEQKLYLTETEKALLHQILKSEVAAFKEGSEELKLKIREKDHRGGQLEIENCNLAKALQLTEDELKTVKSMMDQLNLQVNVGKNLLTEKDTELQGMEQKLYLTETEKALLHQILKNEVAILKEDSEELKLKIREKDHRGEQLEIDNCNLAKALQLAEDELKTVKSMTNQLNLQVNAGKNLLTEKDTEVQGMEQKLYLTETEKALLHQILKSEVAALKEGSEELKFKIREKDLRGELLEIENCNLAKALLLAQDELKIVKSMTDQLNLKVNVGKNLLSEKDTELQGMEHKLYLTETEKALLHQILKNEVAVLKEDREELKLKIREKDQRGEQLEIDNCNLAKALQLAEDELKAVKSMMNQLNLEVNAGKNLLTEKDTEVQGMEQKLYLTETEKALLYQILKSEVAALKEGSEELKLKIREKDHRGELLEIENCNLAKALLLAQDELKIVKSMTDQLNLQVNVGKNLLSEKDTELQGMEQKLYLTETEKAVLHQILKNLNRELIGSKIIMEDQEKKILKLCADSNQLRRENTHIFEAGQLLQEGLQQSHGELEKLKMQEEALHSEIQKQLNEIETWKLEMDVLLGELQVSMFYHILYEQKIHELAEACQSFDVQINSKDKDIKLLKEKVSTLGTENEVLITQLAAYGPAIFSLSQCISSLEKHSYLHGKPKTPDNENTKDIVVAHPVDSTRWKDNENAVATDAFSDLHGLEIRVRSVGKAMVEMEQLVVQENVSMHSKLQAAMQQIEELKSESGLHRRNSAPKSEIFEAENRTLTKDIMLDHVSECSSYRNGRREQAETNNLVFDLWDTTNPTVGKAKLDDTPNAENDIDFHKPVMLVKKKCQHPASDVLVEKDWGDGNLNISKRSTESIQEGNKRKVLQRLDSDVQKLTNLQITVLDLKRELEITEKGKRGRAVAESETLKGQLNEAEAAIHKLFDLTGKLAKNMEDSFGSADMKSALESEEIGNVSRRRISEQARRISEKIGRLQLEVQKLQFVLLKLKDESKGNSMASETKRRVLLRDYLYGGVRKSNKQKKAPFCACIQPPTQGD